MAKYIALRHECELNGKKKEVVKTVLNMIMEELVIWGKATLLVIRKDKILKTIMDLI